MIPVSLEYLGVYEHGTLPQDASVLSVKVDARTQRFDIAAALNSYPMWSLWLPDIDVTPMVNKACGLTEDNGLEVPFPNVGPEEAFPDVWVRQIPEPGKSDAWFIISKSDGELSGPHASEKQAICWSHDGANDVVSHYACYRLIAPLPEGYRVDRQANGMWGWQSIDNVEGTATWHEYPMAVLANIGAWHDKLGNQSDDYRLAAASYRELHDGLSDMVEDGRCDSLDTDDYEWLAESLASLIPGDGAYLACEQLVLAFEKQKRLGTLEIQDVEIALQYAKEAIGDKGVASIVSKLNEDDDV